MNIFQACEGRNNSRLLSLYLSKIPLVYLPVFLIPPQVHFHSTIPLHLLWLGTNGTGHWTHGLEHGSLSSDLTACHLPYGWSLSLLNGSQPSSLNPLLSYGNGDTLSPKILKHPRDGSFGPLWFGSCFTPTISANVADFPNALACLQFSKLAIFFLFKNMGIF